MGPNYGCLGSHPNLAWFYFKIDSSGSIVINFTQIPIAGGDVDVDFICWGPFSSPSVPCSCGLSGTAVDCSYSTSNGKCSKSLNFTVIPKGIYLLEIYTDKQVVYKKIIKN